MKDKVKIGLLLTLFLIICMFVQYFFSYAIDFIILFFSLVAVREFKRLQTKSGSPSFKYVSEIACFLIFVATFVGVLCGFSALGIILTVLAIIFIVYISIIIGSMFIFKKDAENDIFRVATNMSVKEFAFFKSNNTLTTMIYPTIPMFFLYFVNHFQQLGFVGFNEKTAGVPMGFVGLILILMICCLTDTFAMAFGVWIKGKKLCPRISPNKTIAGALFGLLGGVIGAVITYFVFNLIYPTVFAHVAVWQFLIVGFIGSVISQAGDLLESFLKRKANVKDAGEIFRSHGGALDRLDSILFNAPFIFACLLFIFG